MNPATAHGIVGKAIRRGDLKRQPCEVCGAEKVDAHHDDYNFPLDVRWLCRSHHRQFHTPATPAPLMARIELTAEEWAAVRMLAIEQRTTTQRLIGDVLRAILAEKDAA